MAYVGASRGSRGRFVQHWLVSHFLTFKVVPMRLHTSASRPSSPLRHAAAVVAAATLAFSVVACSDDSSSDATSSLTSTTESSESSTPSESETETSETETSSDEPQPTLADTYAEEPSTEEYVEEPVIEEPQTVAQGSCDDSAVISPEFQGVYTVSDCDGQFAVAGMPQTDAVVHMYWNGSTWQRIVADDRTFTGFSCYSEELRAQYGVPAWQDDIMLECD